MTGKATTAWALPVGVVRGVGADRAALLERLGIRTVGDLLLHRPRRYEDRRHPARVHDLVLGQPATVAGTVLAAGVKWFRGRAKSVFELILDDGTGRLHCRWWNVPYLERVFAVGDTVIVHGKPVSLRPRTMDHPETERLDSEDDPLVHLNRVVPIHALTEGLSGRTMRTLLWNALGQFADQVPERDPDLVPATRADGRPWPGRGQAIRDLHFPAEIDDAHVARQRFALEEFIDLQLAIRRRRLNLEANARPLPCAGDNRLIRPFLAALGFRLTTAQTRVLREIRSDMGGRVPMRRLLQGDVGSGKTVVSACAALMALESGCDVAVMAPTEILAGQLAANFRRWLEPLGIRVVLRAGGRVVGAAAEVGEGEPAPVLSVGTHALIQAGVRFNRLGLVIVDEQHKFGVVQREQLVRKGRHPHLLVMTATPIPRTLGLTLYGDLDLSLLDEAPAGRQAIRTHVRDASALDKVWGFVAREVTAGHQAYVVCPRVLAGEDDDARAVTKELSRVRAALPGVPVEMIHGQMPAEERDRVMDGFRSGRVQVLVATQIVEVGVDVPNATVMVILDADRFGLSQLHQLRGRVGRGAAASHCILVATPKTEGGAERLAVLERTTDGFAIADADLRIRGPGELLGKDQSGMPSLRFGDLVEDAPLVLEARELVRKAMPGPL